MSIPNPKIVPTVPDSKEGKAEIKKLVHKLEALPTLPAIATKILTLFAEAEPDVDDIIKLIKSDQALAAKILKLVNSSYYSISNNVTSIENAVMLLGFNELRAALLSVTVSESLISSLNASCAREQTELWKHALATAICAEMIAAKAYPAYKGELFLCGLLHDIGKLVLQECLPDQMDWVSEENARKGAPSFEAENNTIGVDHTIVGKWIAEKWGLPEIFLQAIWLHHHPLESLLDLDFIKQKKVVIIVRLANIFSHRIMADSLTFNHASDDFEALVSHLNLTPAFTETLAISLGRHYSEWATILDFEEDELSFYYQALQRANQRLAGLFSESVRHHALRKTNQELHQLHDLHLELNPLDTVESVIEKVAHTVWLELRAPKGVLYYYNRAEKCLVGCAWDIHHDPKPFTVPVDQDGKPLITEIEGFGEAVARLIETRGERPQTINVTTNELTIVQYSKPYLIVPFVSKGLCIGEMALADDIIQEHDPLKSEQLKTIGYLASITEAALARVALVEEVKGTAETLSSALAKNHQMVLLLKKTNEEFENLLEYSNDAIILHRIDGKVTRINQRAEGLLGYSKEELKTNSMLQKLFAIIRDEFAESRTAPFDVDKGLVFETDLQHRDGTHIEVEVSSRIADSKTGLVQSIIRDVTEKLALEQELIKSQKFESLGVLASGIAHDFNNILTAINGSITLAKMYSKKGEKALEKLVQAEKATQRAKDLTRQLSTFSKGGQPEKKTSSLAEIVTESVGFVLRGSNVRCSCSLPEDLWHAYIDGSQISQVLNNLIINATQAMEGGGTITVSAKNYIVKDEKTIPLAAGNYVAVHVKDEGCGIPPEHMAKIFDPYFTTKDYGNGLGLATAYAIVKKHDGYIQVESTVDKGTTFSFYLPALPEEIAQDNPSAENPVTGKGRILLMDDEEGIRETTGEMLESIGYDVAFAKDGVEAIELYKKAQQASSAFDAVIIDLTVPGSMGGQETMQELHKIDPHVKAVISSGYATDPVMADYEKFGFKDFITKPYQIGVLSRILHAVTTRKP